MANECLHPNSLFTKPFGKNKFELYLAFFILMDRRFHINEILKTGLSPIHLVPGWMVSHSPQVIPLLGFSSSSQLKEDLDAVTTSLDPEVVQRLQY